MANSLLETIEEFKELRKNLDYTTYRNTVKNLVDAVNLLFNEEGKEELGELLETQLIDVRICSECGKMMIEGYCICDGDNYYCSKECLNKHMTDEEFNEAYDDGNGTSYLTEWV